MKALLSKYYLLCTKVLSILILSLSLSVNLHALDETEEDYNLKLLGKYVFFAKISSPSRMACVTCHDPATGWTGSVSGVNLHPVAITGANPHTVGNVKPPTNAYASFIKPFEPCTPGPADLCGGNFWDGRAEGNAEALFSGATKHIGDEIFQGTDRNAYAKYFGPTSDQALNPMPNPVEQNIEQQAVCMTVESSKLAPLYELAWGVEIDCSSNAVAVSAPDVVDTPEKAYNISFKRLMLAIGAWQHSEEVNSFSSKRDMALRAELACFEGSPDADPDVCNHPNYVNSEGKFPLVGLTDQENLGHDIFYNSGERGVVPRGNCLFCHRDNPGEDGTELMQLYSDQSYRNIGVPFNPEMPTDQPSRGLSSHVGNDVTFDGLFKTPTLRNVDKRKDKDFIKAYMHNGWFKSLESVVHFYNTARVDARGATAASFGITRCEEGVLTEKDALAKNCWPEPEFDTPNSIGFVVGNLRMNAEQEAALVAYLKTLSDTITVKAPKPYNKKK